MAVLLYGPVIAAALVGATFLLGRNLGLRPRYAVVGALALAFASPLWVYAKGTRQHPTCCAVGRAGDPCDHRLRYHHASPGRCGRSGWPGCNDGHQRPEFIVLGVVVGALSLLDLKRGGLAGLKGAAVFTATWVAISILGVGFWNLYRTGDLLDTGYRTGTILWQTDRAYIGVFGALASPSFGLLVFMPLAAVGLWGLLGKAMDRPIWFAMLVVVVTAVVGYGSFTDWFGGVSWGPRYLTAVTPFLVLGVGVVLQARATNLAMRLTVGGLAAWSLGISVLGVLFDYQTGWRNLWEHGARPEQVLWEPALFPHRRPPAPCPPMARRTDRSRSLSCSAVRPLGNCAAGHWPAHDPRCRSRRRDTPLWTFQRVRLDRFQRVTIASVVRWRRADEDALAIERFTERAWRQGSPRRPCR